VRSYGVQFYRETERLSAAVPVQFVAGKDLEDIDFHLPSRYAAPLRGRVRLPAEAAEDAQVQITVSAQEAPGVAQQISRTASKPDYAFTMELLPGPYLVAARLVDSGQEYQAVERIELPAGGREISLQLERGIELSGRVEMEGGGAGAPFRVTATPREALNRGAVVAEVKPDGSFTLPDMMPGAWEVSVDPIPAEGYVKGMWLGRDDVLNGEMVLAANNRATLRIVVSMRGGIVTGKVTTSGATPRLGRAFVLLAPADKLAQNAVEYADDAGHFEFEGVRPGRYRIYAFEEMDPQAVGDPGFLKPFEQSSETLEVPEGGRVTKDVPLIPANAPAAPRN